MARKIKIKFTSEKFHLPVWLLTLLGFIFILRIPSFFEPFSYGDEMIYLTLGNAIRKGLILYKDIHDNKPPLLYFLAALAGNVFWFRAILAIWMMFTTILFWKLTNKLFSKETLISKTATITFAILTTLPLLEGQIANAELFMLAPTIIALLILFSEKVNLQKIFLAGIFFSLATLFKVPSAFDMGTIIFLWLIALKLNRKNLLAFSKKTASLALGFLIPISFTLIWYFLRGALNDYLVAAFVQNIGYLSSWRGATQQDSLLIRNFPLLLRGMFVVAGLAILFFYKNKLSRNFIFACSWLLFSLFAVTLSERPYPHYLIQATPAISILFGILIAKKSIEQSLSIIPLCLAILVPIVFKFWHYPTLPYYQRFLELASGRISKEEYFNKFDGNVNRNYKIAKLIVSSTKADDKIFIWGDSPPIYALSRHLPPFKYVATYHINDFSSASEVIEMLSSKNPTLVIVLPNSPDLPGLLPYLNQNYLQVDNIDNAIIWLYVKPVVLKSIRALTP